MVDVSARVAGIGSLGVPRYIALVEGDGSPDGNRLLDIKATAPSSLIGCTQAEQPAEWTDNALRVVGSQRKLQAKPTAVLDVVRVAGEDFRLREMIPDENRATARPIPSEAVEAPPGRRGRRPDHRVVAAPRGPARRRGPLRSARPLGLLPALDAVLASAVRFAERTRHDYKAFRKARLDLQA